MNTFDNVAVAEQFVGKPLGQLIAKEERKSKTIWVYEGSIIRSEVSKAGKVKNFFWTCDGGQELFVLKNKMKTVEGYKTTVRMQYAQTYMVEVAKVYKGFKSIKDDNERGIHRDRSKANAMLANLGAAYRLG